MIRPLLALAVVALLLCACGGGNDPAGAPTPTLISVPLGGASSPANQRQNECIHALQDGRAPMSYYDIVNECGEMVAP